MKIHTSANFESREIGFHSEFELQGSESEIIELKDVVKNHAISKLKEKCENYFKIHFNELIFIVVYFFNSKGEEIKLFEKAKTI